MSDEDGQPVGDGNGQPIDGTREITGFVTYSGEGFAVVRPRPETGDQPVPSPASNRRYLRDGLPGLYRDDDFTMRFVGALEQVLDPIVSVLDALPAHFDPELAPLDILALSTGLPSASGCRAATSSTKTASARQTSSTVCPAIGFGRKPMK